MTAEKKSLTYISKRGLNLSPSKESKSLTNIDQLKLSKEAHIIKSSLDGAEDNQERTSEIVERMNEKLSKSLQKKLAKQKNKELKERQNREELFAKEKTNASKIEENTNKTLNFDELTDSFRYLENLKDGEQLYHNKKAKNALRIINYALSIGQKDKQVKPYLDKGLSHNLTKLLIDHFIYISSEIKNKDIDEEQDLYEQAQLILETFQLFSNYSNRFIEEFHKFEGLRSILDILSNQELIDMYRMFSTQKTDNYIALNAVIRNSIGLLYNLSRSFNDNSAKWRRESCSLVLLSLLDKIGHLEDNQITLNLLINSITSDEEIVQSQEQTKEVLHQIPEIIISIDNENETKVEVEEETAKKTLENYTNKKTTINEILTWTEDDVNKWLISMKVDSMILQSIQPADGLLLHQYYEMQMACPEFFYSSLRTNKQVEFRGVAFFGCQLKKLFTSCGY
jgi:hypothetical protein